MLAVFSGPLQLQKPLPVTNHPTNEGSEAANVCQRLSQATNGTSDHLLNVRTNDGHLLKMANGKRLPRFTKVQLKSVFPMILPTGSLGRYPRCFTKPSQRKKFLHKLLVKRPGYLPGVGGEIFEFEHCSAVE